MFQILVQINNEWKSLDTPLTQPAITLQAANVSELKDRLCGYSQSVSLPITLNNVKIFEYITNPFLPTDIQYKKIPARMIINNTLPMGSYTFLRILTVNSEKIEVQIVSAAFDVFDALNQLDFTAIAPNEASDILGVTMRDYKLNARTEYAQLNLYDGEANANVQDGIMKCYYHLYRQFSLKWIMSRVAKKLGYTVSYFDTNDFMLAPVSYKPYENNEKGYDEVYAMPTNIITTQANHYVNASIGVNNTQIYKGKSERTMIVPIYGNLENIELYFNLYTNPNSGSTNYPLFKSGEIPSASAASDDPLTDGPSADEPSADTPRTAPMRAQAVGKDDLTSLQNKNWMEYSGGSFTDGIQTGTGGTVTPPEDSTLIYDEHDVYTPCSLILPSVSFGNSSVYDEVDLQTALNRTSRKNCEKDVSITLDGVNYTKRTSIKLCGDGSMYALYLGSINKGTWNKLLDPNDAFKRNDKKAKYLMLGYCPANCYIAPVKVINRNVKDIVRPGGYYSVTNNIGIKNGYEAFKLYSQITNSIFEVDHQAKNIRFRTYAELYTNKAANKVKDWSTKLVPNSSELQYKIDGYARRNYVELAESEYMGVAKRFYFESSQENYKYETTVQKLPVQHVYDSNTGKTVVQYRTKNDKGEYSDCKLKTPAIIPMYNGTEHITMEALSFIEEIYYRTGIERIVKQPLLLTADFLLSDKDIEEFDHFTPVWLSQYSRHFYVQQISNYIAGQKCKCTLIAL